MACVLEIPYIGEIHIEDKHLLYLQINQQLFRDIYSKVVGILIYFSELDKAVVKLYF